MIHNVVCGLGPDDLKCPTGAKCMIIPRGENFCCWQDRELPGELSVTCHVMGLMYAYWLLLLIS